MKQDSIQETHDQYEGIQCIGTNKGIIKVKPVILYPLGLSMSA